MIVTRSDSSSYVDLVLTFPVLGGGPVVRDARGKVVGRIAREGGLAPAPGVGDDEIDLKLLDRWGAHFDVHTATRGPFPGDGAVEAVRFVLAVWSTRQPWCVGTFDMFRALTVWDHEQIAAFQAYVSRPFRP